MGEAAPHQTWYSFPFCFPFALQSMNLYSTQEVGRGERSRENRTRVTDRSLKKMASLLV
jgi:hypothetical protein